MTYYLAAKYSARDRIREVRHRFHANGRKVLSSWLDEPGDDLSSMPVGDTERMRQNAERDLRDLYACDTIIIDTLDESPTGGREVELGFAIATGKIAILVGPRRNIFHHLVDEWYADWEAFYRGVRS